MRKWVVKCKLAVPGLDQTPGAGRGKDLGQPADASNRSDRAAGFLALVPFGLGINSGNWQAAAPCARIEPSTSDHQVPLRHV